VLIIWTLTPVGTQCYSSGHQHHSVHSIIHLDTNTVQYTVLFIWTLTPFSTQYYSGVAICIGTSVWLWQMWRGFVCNNLTLTCQLGLIIARRTETLQQRFTMKLHVHRSILTNSLRLRNGSDPHGPSSIPRRNATVFPCAILNRRITEDIQQPMQLMPGALPPR
jgi:hypothetical protein